ncbi:hypothetical protein AeRB84_005358, partial [Aphanomyces euteiches]
MPELDVPLPDDFFQLPKLSPTDVDRYREFGRRASREMLDFTKLKGGRVDWALHSNNSSVNVYVGTQAKLPVHLTRTEVETTLDEVRDVCMKTTVSGAREFQAKFQPVVLDKVRLYNLTLPTPANSYLYQSLNWSIVDTPLRGLVIKRRDITYIEHHEFMEIDGRKAYVQAMSSIEIPGVPDLEDMFHIIRGELVHNGIIFIETDRPGILELMTVHQNKPNGKGNGAMGNFIMRKYVRSHYQAVVNLKRMIRAHQLSQLTFIDQFRLPPLHTQSKCQVCLKAFASAQKGHCRHCAKIVCIRDCSAEWDLEQGALKFSVRICKLCSKHV